MKNKTKAIVTAVSLSAVLMTGGIAAYFTDADTVTNTFTIGKVSIDLQEPGWDPASATNVTPNQEITKDPQIKNDGVNTEFVFMDVVVPYDRLVTVNDEGVKNGAAEIELFTYSLNSGWKEVDTVKDSAGKTLTHRYVYGTGASCTPLAAGSTTPALFDSIKVANIVEDQGIELTNQSVVINAYAIQANDIGPDDETDPEAVWAVIVNQNPDTAKGEEDAKTDILK